MFIFFSRPWAHSQEEWRGHRVHVRILLQTICAKGKRKLSDFGIEAHWKDFNFVFVFFFRFVNFNRISTRRMSIVIWVLNSTNVPIVIANLATFQIVRNIYDNVRLAMFNHLARRTMMWCNSFATFVINDLRAKWEWNSTLLSAHKSRKCNANCRKVLKKWTMNKKRKRERERSWSK